MAVSNSGSITVFNPDNPSAAVTYPTIVNGQTQDPNGLVITNAGVVYYSTSYRSYVVLSTDGARVYADGGAPVSMLDTTTGSVTVLTSSLEQFWLDTASNQIHSGSAAFNLHTGPSNLCISGDGSTLSVNLFFTDSSLNVETGSYFAFGSQATGSIGRRLNQDGSLAFEQNTNSGSINVIARNTGSVLYTVSTAGQSEPYPASQNAIFDALVIAPASSTIGMIGQSGVLFVNVSLLPIPNQDMQVFPAAMPSGIEGSQDVKKPLPVTVPDPVTRENMRSRLRTSAGGGQANRLQ